MRMQNTRLLIRNGKILTMAGQTIENGCILCLGRKIAAIAENIDAQDCQVIDAEGGWIMPGIIDAHSHIGITEEKKGIEGDDCNESMEPITPQLRAIDAINPMDSAFHTAIASGITSVMVGQGSANVVGGQFAFIKTFGRQIDKMIVLAPAAMKVAFGENPKSTYGNLSAMPSTRMSIAAMLRQELFEAKQYYLSKKQAETEGKSIQEDFEYECWLPVFEKAIPLKAHVHRVDDIFTAIRIAKEFDLLLTLDHCSEGHLVAPDIKNSGFPAIVGPNLASRNKIEVQFMNFKTIGVLANAGVKVAITTDHPVTRINCLPICAGLAVKEGLPFDEGLKAITINAAEICRVSHCLGSLEVGKDADIAVFDGNPMEVFTRTLYTIIDGQIVYEKGKFRN
jgi:imidazolonepropionase-like amidohydrolase